MLWMHAMESAMPRLIFLLLAGCTVSTVERPDVSAQQRDGVVPTMPELGQVRRGELPNQKAPVIRVGDPRQANHFGSQEGEPITVPDDATGTPGDVTDDGDTFDNGTDADMDGGTDPTTPPTFEDTGDTGDTGGE